MNIKYILVIVLLFVSNISAKEKYTKVLEIKFGKNKSDIKYLPGGMDYGVFTADKYSNIYYYAYQDRSIRKYNKESQIISTIKINQLVENIILDSKGNIGCLNTLGQIQFKTSAGENIESFFLNSDAGEYILLDDRVLYFNNNDITSFNINSNVNKSSIEVMNENLLKYHNVNIDLTNNVYVDKNKIIHIYFDTLKNELLKINPNAFSVPSIEETPSFLHVDNTGTTYWRHSHGEYQTDYYIYDKLGNLLKKITVKAKFNEINYIGNIGYWGDLFFIKQIGHYSDKYIETDEGSKFIETKPEKMEFYCLKNTWNNLRGNYYTEVAKKGLSTEIAGEVLSIIETLDKEELRKFRNTLFAIKGYKFSSEDLDLYFRSFDWYKPDHTVKNTKDLLTPDQKKLFETILTHEQDD